ncbi:Ras- protein Rab-26 [Chytridiales sp. JEL 0842]|nr:Ras- protein Rab-26 [Chytridiales sp. JEL 0842]
MLDAKKVVVVGSAGAGKTALVTRAVNNTFAPDYFQTFGADLMVKTTTDSKKYSLQIWCCGGHERYRALLDQFYSNAHAALLCFDMLNPASFAELGFWYNEIKRSAPSALIILVGTKSDEADSVAIKPSDAIKQAAEWNVEFRAVSSKTGTNVNELFEFLLQSL